MKTTNLYYATVIKRTNSIKMLILGFAIAICSWPRTFIETFTRSHFGERYFLLPLNLFLAAGLAIWPFTLSYYGDSKIDVISHNISWYAYLVLYVIWSFKKYNEIRREPGVFDLEKFSLSTGSIDERFFKLNIFGTKLNRRLVSIYLEPAFALCIGILLVILKQNIGYLIIPSSIIYSLSYAGQYYLGDQFIMNTIDEMICNEQLINSFVDDLPPEDTKGFETYGRRPNNRNFRRKVVDNWMDEEPPADVF